MKGREGRSGVRQGRKMEEGKLRKLSVVWRGSLMGGERGDTAGLTYNPIDKLDRQVLGGGMTGRGIGGG